MSKVVYFNGLSFFTLPHLLKKEFWILLIKYCCLSILGFFIGNYRVFTDPVALFTGVLGQPAGYNFMKLIFKNMILWDHVNSVSVLLGTFFIPSAIIIFFLIPLFLKNKMYLVSSIVLNGFFWAFITFKSTGLLWHSFPIGIYLILFGIFILKESDDLSKNKQRAVQILMSFAVIMQLINNYGVYIPKQIIWHNITQETCLFLENKSVEIVENIQKKLYTLDKEYTLVLDFYRDCFIDGECKNILQKNNPNFLENFRNIYTVLDRPYTVVLYLESMAQVSMKEVYQKIYHYKMPFLETKFEGYTIAVFENSPQ